MTTEKKVIDLEELLHEIERSKNTLDDLSLIVRSVIGQKKEVEFKPY